MAVSPCGAGRGFVTAPKVLLALWLALLLWGAAAVSPLRPAEPAGGAGAPPESASPLRALVGPGERDPSGQAAPDRARLLEALEAGVEHYATPLQLLGTAPYYSSRDALAAVLAYDAAVTAAAERYGVEKAMVQAVLFQEIRFLNLLDEVDHFVAAAHTYLQIREDWGQSSPQQRLPALPPAFRTDSSTGLGQIFAATAIRAVNWREGRTVYDAEDWHDLQAVWDTLRNDNLYNIDMTALVLAYERSVLREKNGTEPPAADIMQAYNGSGPLSLRYREAVSEYYAAFQAYHGS